MTGPGNTDFPGPPEIDDTGPASRAAELIGQHRAQILDLWIDTVAVRLPGARDKGRSELADHLTQLLDGIVDSLHRLENEGMPSTAAEFGAAQGASRMHGRERSVVTGYSIDQLVHEFILLRRVVTDFCRKSGVGDADSLEVINRIIEFASLSSTYAFANAMQEVRQKLLGTLVHDVRTPLGVVHNYTEMIGGRSLPQERLREIAEVIQRNLRRVSSMLEELLDVAKLSAGEGLPMHFTEADINAAVTSVCEEATYVYSRKIVTRLESVPIIGVFDIAMVIRTLENLLSNAVKFAYQEGAITVSLKDRGEDVQISVHNEGDPISEGRKDTIFNFFSSGGENQQVDAKGWGLGLALIKTVAATHGGDVIFESARGRGTTFGMTLRKHHRKDGEELTVLI